MPRDMLSEVQLKVIEDLVDGEKTVSEILEEYGIARSTFYGWRKQKLFAEKLKEMADIKDEIIDQRIRARVNRYVARLEQIAMKGKNENAATQSLKELLELAGKHKTPEITIVHKNETDEKNYLLDMLNSKEDEQDQDSTVH